MNTRGVLRHIKKESENYYNVLLTLNYTITLNNHYFLVAMNNRTKQSLHSFIFAVSVARI